MIRAGPFHHRRRIRAHRRHLIPLRRRPRIHRLHRHQPQFRAVYHQAYPIRTERHDPVPVGILLASAIPDVFIRAQLIRRNNILRLVLQIYVHNIVHIAQTIAIPCRTHHIHRDRLQRLAIRCECLRLMILPHLNCADGHRQRHRHNIRHHLHIRPQPDRRQQRSQPPWPVMHQPLPGRLQRMRRAHQLAHALQHGNASAR